MDNLFLLRDTDLGESMVLRWFVGLGLFLGFLSWKILLNLAGYCVFRHVESV
jgi:hypothetical protein